MSVPAEDDEDVRWSPEPESVDDYPVEIPIPGIGRIMGRQGLDKDTRRLSEFALTAQIEVFGRWNDVARVDTCHEEVHLHLYSRQGAEIDRKVLRPIRNQGDVDVGYDEAEKMLTGRWAEHARRWNRGH